MRILLCTLYILTVFISVEAESLNDENMREKGENSMTTKDTIQEYSVG